MSNSQEMVVPVQLGERSYSIQVGRGIIGRVAHLSRSALPRSNHAVLIHDQNVASYSETVATGLRDASWRVTRIGVPSGESSKSVEQANRLWQAMLDDHTDRGSCVMALGGGVVGDLAGFMAATFARGIPLIQIPTTLLSQVDSSVGGKTGINLPGAKNIVGAFWQPSSVIIDLDTLQTLPDREFRSGLAEIVKYGVILLPDLFDYLETNAQKILAKDSDCLMHIIAESCRAKALVVQEDERETSGRRAILNYGHTFAHALESASGYGVLLHGEAVAIGMHMAALLALALGRVDAVFVERQRALLQAFDLPIANPGLPATELWQIMQHDKKVEHGKLRFVLPNRLGNVELVPGVEQRAAIQAIDQAI